MRAAFMDNGATHLESYTWPVDPLTRSVYVRSLTALLEPHEADLLRLSTNVLPLHRVRALAPHRAPWHGQVYRAT